MSHRSLSILQCVFCMFVAVGCLFSVLHQRLMRAERRLAKLESQMQDTEFIVQWLLQAERPDRTENQARNVAQAR